MAFSDEQMSRRMPRSTLVLLIVSAFSSISVFFTAPGVPALVLSLFALLSWRRGSFERCRRLTTIGWWVFAAIVVLQVVITVLDVGRR